MLGGINALSRELQGQRARCRLICSLTSFPKVEVFVDSGTE